MATIITEECINCGACEPECPNTAIYQGGVEYEYQGKKLPPLAEDIFYIVPEKCTECVGFYDYEACAAVCPVDCCIPDPNRPESEEVLIARAKDLHPDKQFGDDFPSRFRKGSGDGAAGKAQPTGDGAEAPAAAAVASAAQPAAAAAQTGAGVQEAVTAATAAAGLVGGRIERPVSRPKPKTELRAGDPTRDLDGELAMSFEEALLRAHKPEHKGGSLLLGLGLLAASPFLGALDHETKKDIEQAYGDPRFFSSQLGTAINVIQNFILYPVLGYLVGLFEGMQAFTEADKGWIVLGVLLATAETMVRLRDGIFHAKPADEIRYGAAIYGAPLSLVLRPLVRRFMRSVRSGYVPVDGFYTRVFEPKREREKRYGEVYTVDEFEHGYYVRMELPRTIPPSSAKDELGLGDEMPDYDIRIKLEGDTLVIRGAVVDPQLRAVAGVSPAFPADFKTEIALRGPLAGYRHRYADKLLEIVVLQQGA